jgi:hypothetical protein
MPIDAIQSRAAVAPDVLYDKVIYSLLAAIPQELWPTVQTVWAGLTAVVAAVNTASGAV